MKCEKDRKDPTTTYGLEHKRVSMTIGEFLIYGFKYSYFTRKYLSFPFSAPSVLWCYQTIPEGQFGKFSHVFDVQLFHDLITVSIDGFDAQEELFSNLFDCFAFSKELKYLTFPGRQEVRGWGALVWSARQWFFYYDAGNIGTQVFLVCSTQANSLHPFIDRAVLG